MEEDSPSTDLPVPSEQLLSEVRTIEENVVQSVKADLESASQRPIDSIELLLPDEDEFAVQPFERGEVSVAEHVVEKKRDEEDSETPGSTTSVSKSSIRSSVATLLHLSDSWKDSERKRIFKGILHSIQSTEHLKQRKYIQPTLFHYSSHS